MSDLSAVDELSPLPDIDEVEPYGPADDACFEELRTVLERHGALNRFGITLLHQHFEVGKHEVLVESIDKINRILTSSPLPTTDAEGSVDTSWRLGTKKSQKKCESKCRTGKDDDGKQFHFKQHYTVT